MSNQVNTERLSIKIGLSGTHWAKHPEFSIAVDNIIVEEDVISADAGEIVYYNFDVDIAEGHEHFLKISLLNKDDTDVIKEPQVGEPFRIVKDMLLNIESIEIDDINIGTLMWTHSEFIPKDPGRPTMIGCVNLGWNGTYTLKFTSPFYLWLLENF